MCFQRGINCNLPHLCRSLVRHSCPFHNHYVTLDPISQEISTLGGAAISMIARRLRVEQQPCREAREEHDRDQLRAPGVGSPLRRPVTFSQQQNHF